MAIALNQVTLNVATAARNTGLVARVGLSQRSPRTSQWVRTKSRASSAATMARICRPAG